MDWGGYLLAIDFGTSNTAAATLTHPGDPRGATPSVVRLGEHGDTIPSAVFVRADALITGEEAVRQAGLDPASFEPTPKRRLGAPGILLGERSVDPVDLVAATLHAVVQAAGRRHGQRPPDEVVLTHPEAWGDHLRGKLRTAAERAGLPADRIRLCSEPVAAAYHYATKVPAQAGDRVAVVDFGGGTCDAAVLECQDAGDGALTWRIVCTDGVDPLGGDDFDARLMQWVLDQMHAQGRTDLASTMAGPGGLAARLTLRDQVRRAKHALSRFASAPIPVGPDAAPVTVTATEFDRLIAADVQRAAQMTRTLLARADREAGPRPLQHLFLTGGSSEIRLVQEAFQAVSDGRVAVLDDPKTVTVQGALLVGSPIGVAADPAADGDPARSEEHALQLADPPRRWGIPQLAAVGLALLLAGVGIAAVIRQQAGGQQTTAGSASAPVTAPATAPAAGATSEPPAGAASQTPVSAPPSQPVTPVARLIARLPRYFAKEGSCERWKVAEDPATVDAAVLCQGGLSSTGTTARTVMAGQYKTKALMDQALSGFRTQNDAKTPLSKLPEVNGGCTKPSRGVWTDETGARNLGRWFCWEANDGAKTLRWTVDDAAVILGGEVVGTYQQAWQWWRLHADLSDSGAPTASQSPS